jgi:hypothetical protein
MAIVRWGEFGSAVYIIGSGVGWECVGCDGPAPCDHDPKKFFEHLKWHRDRGDNVPEFVEYEILSYEDEDGLLSYEDTVWRGRGF